MCVGSGSQGRSERNGEGWSTVPADRSAHHPSYAHPQQDGAMGGLRATAVEKTRQENTSAQFYTR